MDLDRTVDTLVQDLGRVSVTRRIDEPFYLKDENPGLCANVPRIHCKTVGGSDGATQDCTPDPTWMKCNTPQVRTVNLTAEQTLRALNTHVAKMSEITLGAIVRSEMTRSVTVWTQDIVNCTKSPSSVPVSISKKIPHFGSVRMGHQITAAGGATARFSATVAGFGAVNATLTFGAGATAARVQTDAATVSDTRSGSGTVSVPANSAMTATFVVWPVESVLPFSMTVTADADLSANDKGWRTLSDTVAAADRTFPVDGTVMLTQASDGVLKFAPAPLDASTCTGADVVARPVALQASGVFKVD